MRNIHKLTHDRPLTGVHWPIHRGWCRGSGTKGDLSTSTGDTHRGAGWRTDAIILQAYALFIFSGFAFFPIFRPLNGWCSGASFRLLIHNFVVP